MKTHMFRYKAHDLSSTKVLKNLREIWSATRAEEKVRISVVRKH